MKSATKTFPSYSTAIDPVTGTAYTSPYGIFTIGAGYIDVWAALSNTDVALGYALSPTAVYNATTGKVSLVMGSGVVWGDSGPWATSIVWGGLVFVNGTSVLWGDSVVWGSSTTQGSSVVWGDGIVWGDSTQTSGESVTVAIQGEN